MRSEQIPIVRIMAYNASGHAMLIDALYLREKAHYCVALSRRCSDLATSQALEALGIELMEKAAELEQDRSFTEPGSDSPKSMKRN
jgi:hypothetical protein